MKATASNSVDAADTVVSSAPRSTFAIWSDLVKARLTFLVLLTTLAGFYAAVEGATDWIIPYPTTHAARNEPTCVKLHRSCVDKNTGTATTNQISRALNRKKRAAESTLTSRLLANKPLNK